MTEKLKGFMGRYKYVALVIAVGLVLLLWPNAPPAQTPSAEEPVVAGDLGQTLETLLTQTEGVGKVTVLLTQKGAVIVCDGAEDAVVRGRVTESVAAATGLGYDKISVIKRKDG
ncbi:hypothetical protein FACS1894202_12930 [Clostridia bacterium]|nr:hypothetical protein FACS1894202_12930 [Clostridia bacterium]